MVVATKMMLVNAMSSLALLIAVAVTSVHASSATSSRSQYMWRMNRPRPQHPPHEHLINIRQSLCSGETHNSLMAMLSVRGGAGTWGKSGMKHKLRHGDDGESVLECDEDCDDECEYEYEYFEVDDDVNDDERYEGADTASDTNANDDDAQSQNHSGDYEGEEDAEEEFGEEARAEIVDAGEQEEDDYEDDDDYLFTTPISKEKKQIVPLSQNRQSVQRARSNLPMQVEEEDDVDDEMHLFETPIPTKTKRLSRATRNANRASKATTTSYWWWQNQNPMTDKRHQRRPAKSKGRQSQSRRRHVSSSRGASFIPPPFYTGSPSRSFDIRAFNGRSFYSDVLSSLTSALGFILQPMGNAIQTITNVVTSTLSRYISLSLSLIRNTLDYMWYGPVEGVTTTGIPTRYGGLSSVLMSGPVLVIASSVVIVSLLSVAMSRRVSDGESNSSAKENDARRRFIRKNGEYDDDSPSIEEELHFLNREFDAANPTTKDRITKSIISTTNRLWPKQQRRVTKKDNRPKSRRGQRQFTIQSIQQWWKERPNQPPIAIIEPQHLRNSQQGQQQPPLGKEINQLQKKLAVSEQERAILQQDVQHLLTKLQRAQELAKSASLHNKWQAKLTSRTDQILGRDNGGGDEDVGGRKAKESGIGAGEQRNNRGRIVGEGEARRDERGVIDRGGIGGRNDLDIQAGPNPRILDGVTIVRDIDDMEDEMEEDGADDYYYDDGGGGDDMKWPAL